MEANQALFSSVEPPRKFWVRHLPLFMQTKTFANPIPFGGRVYLLSELPMPVLHMEYDWVRHCDPLSHHANADALCNAGVLTL